MTNPNKKRGFHENKYLLDVKIGDVTGDKIPDKVSLYGIKKAPSEIFADNITVVIEDGRTHKVEIITPKFNSGYDAKIFLGDFTKDKINDIKLSIDSGGSGGYGFFYVYSFKNNYFKEIFNFDDYNKKYKYTVDYASLYKVDVANITLDKLFILDISYKGRGYLSQYYSEDGKLKKPLQGEVLGLGALVSLVNNEKLNYYDLLAFQRIIGTSNSDTLGYIQNLLSWDGEKFASSRMLAAVPGTNLISHTLKNTIRHY
ncbi:spore coat protein [Clostridium sp. DMHC 10]|nr:spore coat protein [Clostridium sp. DMHC 10]